MSHEYLPPTTPELTPQQLRQLQEFLVSDAVPETTYDYPQVHGFLTALAVSPVAVDADEWLPEIFDGEEPEWPDEATRDAIVHTLLQLATQIARELYAGEPLRLPCALTLGDDPDSAPLRGWAMAFLDGMSLREDDWFEQDEDEVGESLLPIAIAADAFDDENIQALMDDPGALRSMLHRIPAAVSDLYLLFRDEE